jgi:hypothetical protein
MRTPPNMRRPLAFRAHSAGWFHRSRSVTLLQINCEPKNGSMEYGLSLADRVKIHPTGCLPQGAQLDGIWSQDLLTRSRAAIAQFEQAKAGGNPAEMAEARTALKRCHAEVKRFVAAKNAMTKKLAAPGRKLKTIKPTVAPRHQAEAGSGAGTGHPQASA